MRVRVGLAAIVMAVVLASCSSPAGALSVSGATLTDGGKPVRLLGVNRGGTDYVCLQGSGAYFDGPSDQASIDAMLTWHINAVRVPLNPSCWLGTNGIRNAGRSYRAAIVRYVQLLRHNNLYVILNLQLSGGAGAKALEILPMPGSDAVAFWKSAARIFRQQDGVVFDLYNEPHDISWSCWQHGCRIPAGSMPGNNGEPGGILHYAAYHSAGMQQLVNAVRSTGAHQPLLLGGLDFANDLSSWLAHLPRDSDHALVASEHTYGPADAPNVAPCLDACRATIVAVEQGGHPVVTGEMGENDCLHAYIDDYMNWADANGVSYLGFAWDATSPGGWDCKQSPALITSYDGTPTGFGIGLRDHLLALAR